MTADRHKIQIEKLIWKDMLQALLAIPKPVDLPEYTLLQPPQQYIPPDLDTPVSSKDLVKGLSLLEIHDLAAMRLDKNM